MICVCKLIKCVINFRKRPSKPMAYGLFCIFFLAKNLHTRHINGPCNCWAYTVHFLCYHWSLFCSVSFLLWIFPLCLNIRYLTAICFNLAFGSYYCYWFELYDDVRIFFQLLLLSISLYFLFCCSSLIRFTYSIWLHYNCLIRCTRSIE